MCNGWACPRAYDVKSVGKHSLSLAPRWPCRAVGAALQLQGALYQAPPRPSAGTLHSGSPPSALLLVTFSFTCVTYPVGAVMLACVSFWLFETTAHKKFHFKIHSP